MSRRTKSPLGRTSDRQLRAEDSTDDLRRYQECAKKLDECSKNLLRLCQVSGELTNLHDDDIERAANEIMRSEEEEAKKIAAELLHQKGMLNRNTQQDPDCTPSYVTQDSYGQRPRSEGVGKSSTAPSARSTDYEVPKTSKNQQDRSLTDQSSNVHQQVINQPPYSIIHNEERLPCNPYPGRQYSNSGTNRPNPCTDSSISSLGRPNAHSSPYDMKQLQGDGSDRRGPPFFRKAQQQPSQSTWGRPEPVWNTACLASTNEEIIGGNWSVSGIFESITTVVSRNADNIAGGSNPRIVDTSNEQGRKMDETTVSASVDSTNRGMKPQTIRLTAGAGRSSEPPVHIVITAITNDCQATIDNGPHQTQAFPREPVYSDNEFAEDSAYSLGNKGSPNGDERAPRYFRNQQKLVDRGSDAFACPDDATPSSSRPTYKEILDTILSQRPHDAESLLKSKGILNCALKCWEKAKSNLRSKCPQQTNSYRDLQCQTSYDCKEQLQSQTQSFGVNFSPMNSSTECDQLLQNPSAVYSQAVTDAPSNTFAPTPCSSRQTAANYTGGIFTGNKDVPLNPRTQRTVLLKCCEVTAEAKRKQVAGNRCDGVQRQSRPATCITAGVGEALRQYRTPTAPSPCLDRKIQYGQQQLVPNQSQFVTNPRQFEVNQSQFGANQPPRGPSQQFGKNSQPCGQQYQYGKSSQPCGQQYQYGRSSQPCGQQYQYGKSSQPCGEQNQLGKSSQSHGQQYQYGKSSQPHGQQYQYGKSSQPCDQQYQRTERPQSHVPQQSTSVPKTYQCTQICPPTQKPITLQCAPSSTVNRTRSLSKMKSTTSEMDSSILLAIAKAAINLSIDSQRGECEDDEEDEEDCDSEYNDLLETIFEE